MMSSWQDEESATTSTFRNFILGTAGHIDHGKSTLVQTLTGTNPDRLPEELKRGMTIELGFASLTIGDRRFGIVDVPGHERFVRTMVAGATGVDIALIVVAADDSVMPQTVEHVEILHLLGVAHAVVAVTKIDMVDGEMVELVVDEIGQLLAGTPLADSAICPISSVTKAGIEELKKAICAVARKVEATSARPPFRIAVDRAFTVQGRGTVITGSVLRGSISTGDTLEVWPGLVTCRVREMQTHGVASDTLARGQRAAINISGIDRKKVPRGAELATPGYLQSSPMVDVKLTTLSSDGRKLKSASIVRLEIGTVEVPVRIVLLEGTDLQPGQTSYAQLRCGNPLGTVYGQRFIIRDENAMRTIGGGLVLRPIARRKRRDLAAERLSLQRLETGDEADRVEEVLRAARFTTPTDLQLCARSGVELDALADVLALLRKKGRWVPVAKSDVCAVPAAVDDLADRMVAWLERHHRSHPELPGRLVDTVIGWLERMSSRSLARPLFESFQKSGKVKLLGRFVCSPAFAPSLSTADEKLLAVMIDEIRAGGFQPPSLETLSVADQADRKRWGRLATLAVALGELVKIDAKIYLHAEVEILLRKKLADLIDESGGVTVAQTREVLDSSRKYVVPFLEHLDRDGFTKRVGDKRVLVDQGGGS